MSVELPKVAFEYALLCEDVRREDNGKLMLAGVYANSILLTEFPGVLRLRLLLRLQPKTSDFPLNIRVKVSGKSVLIIKGRLTSSALEAEMSSSPEFVVQLDEPGTLEFEVSDEDFEISDADGAGWARILSIPAQLLVV